MTARGFTLIELLISLTILGIVMTVVSFDGIDGYERMLSRSDSSTILTALLVARADAVNGICTDASNCVAGVAHGVHLERSSVTVFEGSQYADRFVPADLVMPLSGYTNISGDNDIVFEPLSADTLKEATITISITGEVSRQISINELGAINSSP